MIQPIASMQIAHNMSRFMQKPADVVLRLLIIAYGRSPSKHGILMHSTHCTCICYWQLLSPSILTLHSLYVKHNIKKFAYGHRFYYSMTLVIVQYVTVSKTQVIFSFMHALLLSFNHQWTISASWCLHTIQPYLQGNMHWHKIAFIAPSANSCQIFTKATRTTI